LTPAIAEKAVNHPTLYLFIRTPQAYAPLAVKRIDSPSFPLSYRLTERDNMAGEGFFDGDITVVARLDADGAAGPKQPDDFESAVTIAKGSDRRADVTLAP
jgi:cytochrome c-type biogenesis protein CcmH